MTELATTLSRHDVRDEIRNGPISYPQLFIIGVCALLLMFDGYDVLALSFSAPRIAHEWHLPARGLGLLFSAGLAGVMAGTFVMGPLADKFGRRPTVVASTLCVSAGMLCSAAANSIAVFALTRVLTGIGVGGLLSVSGALIFEYMPVRYREFGLGLNGAGFPLGAMVGGSIASPLMTQWGWRSVFLVGGIASTVLLPLVVWQLPESADFLIERRPRHALRRLNAILAKLNLTQVERLPEGEKARHRRALHEEHILSFKRGLPIFVGYFLFMAEFYFLLSWLPKLLVDSGQSERVGITTLTIVNIGGIAGVLGVGAVTWRFGVRRTTATLLALGGLGVGLFGILASRQEAVFALAAPVGFVTYASTICLYSTAATTFPTALRVTGISFALTAGKLGSILSPYVAGQMHDAGVAPLSICVAYAVPGVVAALVLLMAPANAA